MNETLQKELTEFLESLKKEGLYKEERIIQSPQGREITVTGEPVLNFCANNYLGLSGDRRIIEAAQRAMDEWGYGLSSVRFICGTQTLHKQLEQAISSFLKTEDTILFSSCFDANAALFEPLLGQEDAIISDELNHASIIDGVRLSKAKRLRYRHSDMGELEARLKESQESRRRLIVTDGVFSMDGDVAKLSQICDLAERYDALVAVDDSHATGYLGSHGRGSIELCGVEGRVDLITTTFGKACGGASGGCISGHKLLIDLYRQRARPYLFSNTLAPAICGGTLKVLDILSSDDELRKQTMKNARHFRTLMQDAGFDLIPAETAIVAVMVYDEAKAVELASRLLKEGIYVIGFSYPVVPKGTARIRVQLSASHTDADIARAVSAFTTVGKAMGLVN
ncbi:MAG TPA: glycine C-acetyltransferase [Sphaerochaeta sp.]|jgi:glycine C-acetyltransferase|nr:glycine C-acetyltransferase [Sphaerochaeta sp.]HPK46296.1 glycine C-acetyltransferase [Sphaerochaeta sp.]HPY11118.1 glycine C-acetyltransferase [Sphaerochaeta sp.]HQB89855.1 glycine C-acetyltransferase [Sphaerochaeta sp.]